MSNKLKNVFRKAWKVIMLIVIIVLLTLISEVGGIVFLCTFFGIRWFVNRWDVPLLDFFWWRQLLLLFCFSVFYTLIIFWIVPPLAKLGGKVPLPIDHPYLRPANLFYAWTNRHYVTPAVRNVLEENATQFARQFIGGQIFYLDGGFPFGNVPLPPHRTHKGTQADIAFCYLDAATGKAINGLPSNSGYGVFEPPHAGEPKTTDYCKEKGFAKYDFNKYFTFGKRTKAYRLDPVRTTALVQIFAKNPKVGKILIEPHLEQRWGLVSFGKVRFHGCQAVRHDDHFHIEVYR